MSNKLQQGRMAARAGDMAEARRLLQAAVEQEPDNPAAWLELAGVVESLQEKGTCFAQVLALEPDHPAASAGLRLVEQKLAAGKETQVHHQDQSLQAGIPPPASSNLSYCYRHPTLETGLRCNRCNQPICPKCAQRSPVGFRCPDCVTELEGRYYSQIKDGEVHPYARPLHQPLVSYVLIGLIITGWLCMELAGGSTTDEVLIRFGANYGPFILQGEIWRLFTSMFLHIGAQHLVFNLVGLVAFGLEMERLYGRYRYLIIYLLAGLFGNLLSFTLRGPAHYSAGASGAIYGIVGMHLAFFWLYRHKLGEFGRQRRNFVLTLVVIGLILGLTVMPADNLAHIGGFLAGAALGYGLAPRYRVDPATTPQRIVDRAALTRRWWVPTLGFFSFGVGLWLALSFWVSLGGQIFSNAWPDPAGERGIEYGQTIEAQLKNEEGDIWAFEGKAGQIITIVMHSDSFDTYLELYGPDETLLAEDDDSGKHRNAKIRGFRLPVTGTYRIVAFGLEDSLGNPYKLILILLGRGEQALRLVPDFALPFIRFQSLHHG